MKYNQKYGYNSIKNNKEKNIQFDVEEKYTFEFIYNCSLKITINYLCKILLLYFSLYQSIPGIILDIHKNKLLKEIEKFENKHNFINEKEILNFYDTNYKNILLEPNKNFIYNLSNPDISVILLMYNQENIIHTSLRSIQNQSLKNIEIIIIDDCSTDNSISSIKNILKEDDRIKLIQHDINEGKIKSRSEGIKLAKGKYITIIDGDDALIHKNILYKSFKIGDIGNLDIY